MLPDIRTSPGASRCGPREDNPPREDDPTTGETESVPRTLESPPRTVGDERIPPIASPNKQGRGHKKGSMIYPKLSTKYIRTLQKKLWTMLGEGYPRRELIRFLVMRGVKEEAAVDRIIAGSIKSYNEAHRFKPYKSGQRADKESREPEDRVGVINAREPGRSDQKESGGEKLQFQGQVLDKLDRIRVAKTRQSPVRIPARKPVAPVVQAGTPLQTKLSRADAARLRALSKLESAQAHRDATMAALRCANEPEPVPQPSAESVRLQKQLAATKVQSLVRGRKGRKSAGQKRHLQNKRQLENQKQRAAIALQAQARGMQGRKKALAKHAPISPTEQFSIRGMQFVPRARRVRPVRKLPGEAELKKHGVVLSRYVAEADDMEGDMFRIIDKDGDGLISAADMCEFMESNDMSGMDLSQLDVGEMLRAASKSREDGMLTVKDFAEYLRTLQEDPDADQKKKRVAELDATTRRAMLIARLQGKLTRAIEDDPRFIRQKKKVPAL